MYISCKNKDINEARKKSERLKDLLKLNFSVIFFFILFVPDIHDEINIFGFPNVVFMMFYNIQSYEYSKIYILIFIFIYKINILLITVD